jgi:hypothetical protein
VPKKKVLGAGFLKRIFTSKCAYAANRAAKAH